MKKGYALVCIVLYALAILALLFLVICLLVNCFSIFKDAFVSGSFTELLVALCWVFLVFLDFYVLSVLIYGSLLTKVPTYSNNAGISEIKAARRKAIAMNVFGCILILCNIAICILLGLRVNNLI